MLHVVNKANHKYSFLCHTTTVELILCMEKKPFIKINVVCSLPKMHAPRSNLAEFFPPLWRKSEGIPPAMNHSLTEPHGISFGYG